MDCETQLCQWTMRSKLVGVKCLFAPLSYIITLFIGFEYQKNNSKQTIQGCCCSSSLSAIKNLVIRSYSGIVVLNKLYLLRVVISCSMNNSISLKSCCLLMNLCGRYNSQLSSSYFRRSPPGIWIHVISGNWLRRSFGASAEIVAVCINEWNN